MAANCDVCGKGPGFGNNISHSHRRTSRRWNPNIQRVRTVVGRDAEARERLHLVHQGRQGLALTSPLARGHCWLLALSRSTSGGPAFCVPRPRAGPRAPGAAPACRARAAPAVVDRADARAEREAGRDRAGDVVLRRRRRLRHGPPRPAAPRSRREGAARAVGVPVVVAGRAQPVLLGAVREQVHGVPGQMAALDQRPPRPEASDRRGRPRIPASSSTRTPVSWATSSRFGRGDGGHRQQLRCVRSPARTAASSGSPCLETPDRVDDDGGTAPGEQFGHGLHEFGRGEHARS